MIFKCYYKIAEAEKSVALTKKDSKKKKKKGENKESRSKADRENLTGSKSERQTTNGHTSAVRLKSEEVSNSKLPSPRKGNRNIYFCSFAFYLCAFRYIEDFLIPGGVITRLCKILFILLFWLVVLSILAVLSFVTLPLFDQQRSDSISNYLEVKTGQPVRHYQKVGTQYVQKLIENTVSWNNELQIVVKEYYSKYFNTANSKSDL